MFTPSTRCHQGREFICGMDSGKLMVWQMVQDVKSSRRLFTRHPNPGVLVFEGQLPTEFSTHVVIGQPVIIGSYGNLHIFQYANRFDKYINFLAINFKTKELKVFGDTSTYIKKSMVMEYPLECHINLQQDLLLFRLNQKILTRRKWSKVIMASNQGDGNNGGGTENKIAIQDMKESSLRDCRDQAMAFHPFHPSTVVTAVVDEFCSKCTLVMYDIGNGNEKCKIKEVKHKVSMSAVHIQTTRGIDNSDEEEDDAFFLKTESVSMAFCKSGDVLVVCVHAVNNPQPDYMNYYEGGYHHYSVKLLQFHPDTLELLTSNSHDALMNEEDSCLNALFTPCDSAVQLWDYNDGSGNLRIIKLMTAPLYKPLNLKSLCRSKILQRVRMDRISLLPLPQQILNFLKFQ